MMIFISYPFYKLLSCTSFYLQPKSMKRIWICTTYINKGLQDRKDLGLFGHKISVPFHEYTFKD